MSAAGDPTGIRRGIGVSQPEATLDPIQRKPEHRRTWQDVRPSEVARFLIDVERLRNADIWSPTLASAGLLLVGAAVGAAISDGVTWPVTAAVLVGIALLIGAVATRQTQKKGLSFVCADFHDWIDEWDGMFPGYKKNSEYIEARAKAKD